MQKIVCIVKYNAAVFHLSPQKTIYTERKTAQPVYSMIRSLCDFMPSSVTVLLSWK